jgi:farnesyl diphosphate synthase
MAIARIFDERYSSAASDIEWTFASAMRYAVEGWGKRIRPILAILVYEYSMRISEKEIQRLDHVYVGLEYIHCYTLVHDDLPCLDNDEYRRGKLTVWKAYSEPLALLVGDALQTLGFECLASVGDARLIHEVARALGDLWVVRGQVRDSLSLQTDLPLDELIRLHDEKTGIFIVASLLAWGILAGVSDIELDRWKQIGIILGRAFQYKDDILDATTSQDVAGKATGKDVALGKGIVAQLGLDQAQSHLRSMRQEVLVLMQDIHDEKLHDIVDYIFTRDK